MNKIVKNNIDEKEFLEKYNPNDYERPSVTVDILLFTIKDNKLKVLLIKRKNHPYKDFLAFPGGFVDINESVEDAAYRELKEETNVDNAYIEQLYTFGNVDRDPRMRVISIAYIGIVNYDDINAQAGDDAKDVLWVDVNNDILHKIELFENSINKKDSKVLAFDHDKIIKMAIERMRNKIFYTDISLKFIGEKFVLRDLQNIFEEILDCELHKANFRRDIVRKLNLIDTHEKEAIRGRKSKIYTYQDNKISNNYKID